MLSTRDEYDTAAARRRETAESLRAAAGPADRARLFADYAEACTVLARTCDPSRLPALAPGEGSSWQQVWSGTAAIARELGAAEAGLVSGGRALDDARGSGAGRGAGPAWAPFRAETNRFRRADQLDRLYDLLKQSCGSRAAQLVRDAAEDERRIARLAAIRKAGAR